MSNNIMTKPTDNKFIQHFKKQKTYLRKRIENLFNFILKSKLNENTAIELLVVKFSIIVQELLNYQSNVLKYFNDDLNQFSNFNCLKDVAKHKWIEIKECMKKLEFKTEFYHIKNKNHLMLKKAEDLIEDKSYKRLYLRPINNPFIDKINNLKLNKYRTPEEQQTETCPEHKKQFKCYKKFQDHLRQTKSHRNLWQYKNPNFNDENMQIFYMLNAEYNPTNEVDEEFHNNIGNFVEIESEPKELFQNSQNFVQNGEVDFAMEDNGKEVVNVDENKEQTEKKEVIIEEIVFDENFDY